MLVSAYTIVSAIVAFASIPASAADGPLGGDTCEAVKLWNPGHHTWFLKGNCSDEHGASVYSLLLLDTCYEVAFGSLAPRQDGNGLRHCNECYLEDHFLNCTCTGSSDNLPPATGGASWTQVDLTDTISVDGGALACFYQAADLCDNY
ncbi:uncharacterized protein PG998_015119 [Apiospora kogelbergensis]|uniref:uncharacterized protein n=1 Tax=Apiospora kogelbergensis TaxID=1337665 RepID=UPI0031322D05